VRADEAYRAQQMETRKFGEAKTRKLDNPKFKEEEEALRKRFTEQVKLEEARFRQWEQRVYSPIPGRANLSLLRNETVLTRTWKLRTHQSSRSNRNWKAWPEAGIGVERDGGENGALLSIFLLSI
jgi:septin family protein